MNGNKISLKQKNVTKVFVNITNDTEESVDFNFIGKAFLKVPTEEEDCSFLVSSIFENRQSEGEDKGDKFKLEIDYFFESERKLEEDEYDDVVSNECLAIIQKDTHRMVAEILAAVGITETPIED